MVKTNGIGSKVALPVCQKTWLDAMPSTKTVSGNRKIETNPLTTFEEEKERNYEEQRDVWAREGLFWCKRTETFSSRRDGQPNKPISGHWFHNKQTGRIKKYEDLHQPPVETKEVFFFQ